MSFVHALHHAIVGPATGAVQLNEQGVLKHRVQFVHSAVRSNLLPVANSAERHGLGTVPSPPCR